MDNLIRSIPETVTYVNLKNNPIFRGRSLRLRDQMLRELEPYNKEGRLNLLNTGEDDWIRAVLPLINGVEQGIVPNMDCAYHITTFLGAKSQRLFQSLIKKERVSTPTKIAEPARANEIINAKNISP